MMQFGANPSGFKFGKNKNFSHLSTFGGQLHVKNPVFPNLVEELTARIQRMQKAAEAPQGIAGTGSRWPTLPIVAKRGRLLKSPEAARPPEQ